MSAGSSRVTRIGVGGMGATTAVTDTQTVSAGASTRVTVREIPEGTEFIATSLSVATVQDPGGNFDVALFNGESRATPDDAAATMSTDELTLPAVSVYETGDAVEVLLDATDRSAAIDVSVHVAGIKPEQVEELRLAGVE